jgi:hypothetical protein
MESETEKRVREYWAKAYDADAKNKNGNRSIYNIGSLDFAKNNDNDNQLPYEPTAVLSKTPSNQARKRSIYDISSLDFTA